MPILLSSAGFSSRGSHRLTKCLAALFIISAAALARADDPSTAAADRPATGRYTDYEKLVAETHKLRSNPLVVTADKVDYRFGGGKERIEMNRYDAASPETLTLPRINGTTVDLRPPTTYHSPYLNSNFGSDRVSVTVGPVTQVLEFSEQDE